MPLSIGVLKVLLGPCFGRSSPESCIANDVWLLQLGVCGVEMRDVDIGLVETDPCPLSICDGSRYFQRLCLRL